MDKNVKTLFFVHIKEKKVCFTMNRIHEQLDFFVMISSTGEANSKRFCGNNRNIIDVDAGLFCWY